MKYLTYIEIATAYNASLENSVKGDFNQSTFVVAHLYSRMLNEAIKDLHKIRIELTTNKNIYDVFPADSFSKIAHFNKTFDFDHYFVQPKTKRRKIILETLYEAIRALCEKASYDLLPFTAAYEKVKALNYENRYVYGKLKSSPNRKTKACIEIEVTEEAATISVVTVDVATGAKTSTPILRTLPHYLFIYRFVHKGKWTNSKTFTVSDKQGEVSFEVSVDDLQVKTVLNPKNHTLVEIEKELEENKLIDD